MSSSPLLLQSSVNTSGAQPPGMIPSAARSSSRLRAAAITPIAVSLPRGRWAQSPSKMRSACALSSRTHESWIETFVPNGVVQSIALRRAS